MTVETIVERIIVAEVVREAGGTETLVERLISSEVVTEKIGPAGRQGTQGPPGKSFDFQQPTPQTTWTIAHNLGIRPSVSVLSVGGMKMGGDVVHLTNDVLQVEFLIPVAGSAHLV